MWLEQDKTEDQNRLTPTPGSPSIGAGGGNVQAGGTSSNPSTQTPVQAPQPEQKFATVQDYLGANQQQGEQLGQSFTNKLGATADQERNTIAGAAGQTKNDINANNIAFDSNIVNTAATDPTKVANDPGQLDSFLKQWNASYKGPDSFEGSANYGTAADAATKANEKKVQLETAGGQQQLLQDEYGVYGQGNKGLDQALLQTSSYFPKVQNQAKEFGSIQDFLGQQATDVNTAAQAAKTATDQTRASAQAPFANKLTEFQAGLNDKVAAKKADAQAVADKYKTDLTAAGVAGTGDPTALLQDITSAGASPAEIKTLQDYFTGLKSYKMGGDFNNFANMNPNVDVTPANVAAPEDYAKAAAYQKLTGVNYGGVLNPADAGKVTPEQSPFDVQGLTGYLKGQVGPRDKELLSGDFNTAVSKAIGTQLGSTGPNAGDETIRQNPQMAAQVATSLIQAAQRSGDTTNLAKFYDSVKKQWDADKNWYAQEKIAFNPDKKEVAGRRAFLNQVGKVLGKPQV